MGAKFPIQVITDHKNLEYFMTTKKLNRRQARWAAYLANFNLKIQYRPGSYNSRADALTRQSADIPEPGDPRLEALNQTVIPDSRLALEALSLPLVAKIVTNQEPDSGISDSESEASSALNAKIVANQETDSGISDFESEASSDHEDPSIDELFIEAYAADPYPIEVLQSLKDGLRRHNNVQLSRCSEIEGRLYYDDKLWVPDHHVLQLRLVKEAHDAPVAGHPGVEVTVEHLDRTYYWPGMNSFVRHFVRNYYTCHRAKYSRLPKQGFLRPLPVLNRPWRKVSLDFIIGLLISDGYDAILVVIDRLSKKRHLIPCNSTYNARDLVDLFIDRV